MDFDKMLKLRADYIENSLDKYLPFTQNYQSEIYNAMRYSLLEGGKRIRGILTLSTCLASGGNFELAMPYAGALEMIHAYSLIHDDLPAMDNDDYRRGKLTCHKKFGEAMAILAGDGLLNCAFEIILNNNKAPLDLAWRAMTYIATCAGVKGMIGGQIVDLYAENKNVEYDVLSYIHKLKTGALIKAAAATGIIIGGGSDEMLLNIEKYAENIGLAFQIQDDILDIEGSLEVLGKPIGSDEKNNKSTYVSIYGMDNAKRKVEQLTLEAKEYVSTLGEEGLFLSYLADALSHRNH